ncbi:sulfite exporter TauE/SafE family protein [Paenisporosarcina cavernae]|uniref:Probable membrane transporter protein n=1 Tax=Paenisporosarcina cavernae TaxID=2320858 RepID=A0A385YPE6_9BACL|nr:TSUP family transporter [Paenisporosarcina cavernae]AYC28575.1 sulfite exporter TauE/SafE family protein [Paenisporosarcina cavernae]
MEYITLFVTGIVATTIGTLAGGGGLISLPIMMLLGMPIHSAIGANKVSNSVSSTTSFLTLLRKKQITLKQAWWIAPISLTGGVMGGLLANSFTSEQLSIIAIGLLLFAFATSFLGRNNFDGTEILTRTKKSMAGLLGIGIYDGFFGPGQGTLMLFLFNHLRIGYVRSVALVRFATMSSCIGAAISYIFSGNILWALTLCLMAGSITGAQLGVRIAENLNPKHVKPILRVVTALLIVQIAWGQIS